jgi:mannitol/fructose-specific phosphotransferase system IIA component (Ntr-type)
LQDPVFSMALPPGVAATLIHIRKPERQRFLIDMKIVDQITPQRIQIGLTSTSKPEILRELVLLLERDGVVRDVDSAVQEFLEREAKGSTGIGNGIGIPHVRSDLVEDLEYVLAVSEPGVDFESLDGEPIHILVMMMAPKSSHGIHIKALAKVSRILNDETVRIRLRKSGSPEEVLAILSEREEELS